MRAQTAFGAAVLFIAACLLTSAAAQTGKPKTKTPPKTVNDRVVEFAKAHLGEQVGNGECWTLANEALKSAEARSSNAYIDSPDKGDYVWGDLVYAREIKNGKAVEMAKPKTKIMPGDIVQFRDAKFAGRKPEGGTYSKSAPHHTAIVLKANADDGTIVMLHQNFGGKKTVMEVTFTPADLQEGWMKIYHPLR